MTFTIESATGLAILICAVLAGFSTAVVNIIVAIGSRRDGVVTKQNTEALLGETAKLHTTATKIEAATDGTLHTLTAANQVMQEKIDGLEKLVSSMIAGARSQTAAVTEAGRLSPQPPLIVAAPVVGPSPVATTAPVVATLKRIEENTGETAANTKRTDDNMQDLKDKA